MAKIARNLHKSKGVRHDCTPLITTLLSFVTCYFTTSLLQHTLDSLHDLLPRGDAGPHPRGLAVGLGEHQGRVANRAILPREVAVVVVINFLELDPAFVFTLQPVNYGL